MSNYFHVYAKENPRSADAEQGRFQFPKEAKLLGSSVLLSGLLGLLSGLLSLLLALLGGLGGVGDCTFGGEGSGECCDDEGGDDLLHDVTFFRE